MTTEEIKILLSRMLSSTPFCVLMVCAMLWGGFILLERSDTAILENRTKYRLRSMHEGIMSDQHSADEQRVAKHFAVDTLPGLLQRGLIKKYKRERSGTVVFVAGNLWNERTEYFRQCLLKELFIYNKVNGFEPSTRVVDSRSGKLYAEITPPTRIQFFN